MVSSNPWISRRVACTRRSAIHHMDSSIPGRSGWREIDTDNDAVSKTSSALSPATAQLGFLLHELGSQRLAEILGGEVGPQLELIAVTERSLLRPIDGLVQRTDFPDPIAGQLFACGGERA